MEHHFKAWTLWLATGVEVAASVVVAVAVLASVARTVAAALRRGPPDAAEGIRLRLGRWLTLALEFELAADVLRTAVSPTWNEIGKLAAIVVLRTVLNYFLQREIDRAATPRAATSDERAPSTSGAAPSA